MYVLCDVYKIRLVGIISVTFELFIKLLYYLYDVYTDMLSRSKSIES